MSLEDEQEHYTADAGRQEADGERGEPPRKLPPINNPLQPPQPPASDPPSDENPSSWRQNTKLGLEIFGLLSSVRVHNLLLSSMAPNSMDQRIDQRGSDS